MQTFFVLLLQGITVLLTTTHVCAVVCIVEGCILESKIEHYNDGFGIDKQPLEIDIGECNTTYPTNISSACFDENRLCAPRCAARSYNVQLYNGRKGPVAVPVIRSCRVTRQHCLQTCQRVKKIQYFFPESKYQSRIDIGECVCAGGCPDSNESCIPTKTLSKSVTGPNGDITVDVIQECECVDKKCHRIDYWESHWDHVTCGQMKMRTEKLINVGRCQGDCNGIFLPSRCYPSDDSCLLYIPGGRTQCVPDLFDYETYVDVNLNNQTIPTISTCRCQSA